MFFSVDSLALPPLQAPNLAPRPSLLPFLPDAHLAYIAPIVLYWIVGLTFQYVDSRGLLSTYKLHTPAELLRKNRASQWDVIKFALLQQTAQCTYGFYMAGDTELFPSEQYSLILWARRIRGAQLVLLRFAQSIGLSAMSTTKYSSLDGATLIASPSRNSAAGLHLNGTYNQSGGDPSRYPYFSSREILLAWMIHSLAFPTLQYLCALALADSWQYFTHRIFHANKWLYKHIHSLHHDVYVPFAYGAFYNHPLETIPVDVLGFPICMELAGLDNRQAALFGCMWTFKTVVDHCGYDFPYNPNNIICPNSVLFHDLHHQSWGMKFNFSNYGTFWDRVLGTYLSGRDPKVQEKYSKGRAMEEVWAADAKATGKPVKTEIGSSTAVER